VRIAIVGAGLGGLSAAALLIRAGHQVKVLEQSAELGEVGAGIQVSANAMKVLEHLGVRARVEPLAVRPLSFEFRRFDNGDLLHTIPLGDSHEQRHGSPYFQLHRSDLHAALVATVRELDPMAIELGVRVTRLQEHPGGVSVALEPSAAQPTAPPTAQQHLNVDLVVGADGIRSVVREHLGLVDRPTPTGQVAWRCTVPTALVPPELRTALVSTIWCGPANHAVTYYLRTGELINFVGCVESDAGEESWTDRRPWSELDADYQGWHPMVRAVIDRADRQGCFRWSLRYREPPLRWSSDRVTLLGDSAHATLPYMAQGAAMAIEDGAVLQRCLDLPDSLSECLKRYESLRRPRTARVVRESAEMGELYHIGDAKTMREAFEQRNIAASRNGWLYPYNPMTAALES
jgi:salicylate hydroxylase